MFDTDNVVACHVTEVPDLPITVFGDTVNVILAFTFEDIHGNEQVELQAVVVDVPTIKEME